MRKSFIYLLLLVLLTGPGGAEASLSAGLGATKLDGLERYNQCQRETVGYRERVIADRLELKLANTPNLSPEHRQIWLADIQALRQAAATGGAIVRPQYDKWHDYSMGLTDAENQAIQSMLNRFVQEVNLKCEQKYGGMTRYSPGSDQSGQIRYENELRAKMHEAIDVSTLPVEPLPSPFPKSKDEIAAEKMATERAQMSAMQNKFADCQSAQKGMRLSIMADIMQKNLDSAKGLSAKDRAAFEQDIKDTRASAAKGLEQVEASDPKNPYRALMRLTQQDHMAVATEFSKQSIIAMQNCTR